MVKEMCEKCIPWVLSYNLKFIRKSSKAKTSNTFEITKENHKRYISISAHKIAEDLGIPGYPQILPHINSTNLKGNISFQKAVALVNPRSFSLRIYHYASHIISKSHLFSYRQMLTFCLQCLLNGK